MISVFVLPLAAGSKATAKNGLCFDRADLQIPHLKSGAPLPEVVCGGSWLTAAQAAVCWQL